MLSERIMDWMGWEAVWCPAAGEPTRRRREFIVGTWTGPDGDLLCVRRCGYRISAEESLSPAAGSILGATLKALVRYWRTR